MAEQSAGRVSLHPCFRVGLSTASVEITGEGGTPALFLSPAGVEENKIFHTRKEREMGNRKAAGGKSNHRFSFVGGDKLDNIAASWFVSYAYYVHIDRSHRNWNRVAYRMRVSRFEKTVPYHLYWLDKIGPMDDRKLATNEVGLTPAEVKKMAKEILRKFW